MATAFDETIDCSGMACPMPILKTKKAIDSIDVGKTLKMIATDPGAPSDVQAWANKTGHKLVGQEKEGDKFIFYIKKNK
jgi:tRNA 2-thiouridine synthesizing protein A